MTAGMYEVQPTPSFVHQQTKGNSEQQEKKEKKKINGLEGLTYEKRLEGLNMYSLTKQQLRGGGIFLSNTMCK